MAYNKRKTLQDNLESIKLAYQILEENRKPNTEEQEILQKFNGWGGIKELLLPLDNIDAWTFESLKIKPLIHDLHEFLTSKPNYESLIESIKNSILTSFYTSPELINSIGKALLDNQVKVDKFLDPSAGTGLFVNQFERVGLSIKESLLLEKDELTSQVLKALHTGGVNVPFETLGKNKLAYYDLIASNIPFGDFKVFDEQYNLPDYWTILH